MIISTLTREDLAFIEADLRNGIHMDACKDCQYRNDLANKVAQLIKELEG